MSPSTPKTLSQRLSEGKIAVPEGLQISMRLAEALRKRHDAGRAHGALTPASVVIGPSGVDLLDAPADQPTVTPYTAPEVVQGKVSDPRSDVFAFGTILYEILTGRRAFEADGQTALTLSLMNSTPPSTGSPAVDRLVSNCVTKDPAVRWQRMQQIIMELKLLTVAVRRAEAPAPQARGQVEGELRAEMQRMEARVTARMEKHEAMMAQMQHAATEAVQAMRGQLASLTEHIGNVQQQLSNPAPPPPFPMEEVAGVADRTVAPILTRVAALEQAIEEIRRHANTLQENVAADLHDLEQGLKAQAGAIESARTAMAQTDDLVERVVEALELLQTSVLDQQEDRASMVN